MTPAYDELIYAEDIPSIPSPADEDWLHSQEGDPAARPHPLPAPAAPVRIVDFASFIATEEPSAEPLLGTPTETLLPLDGMLLMYGDGGAGKTTLTIDAVSHLASGSRWLGVPVERPVSTLMIENEGPRGKFRQRLAEKHASWNGHPPFHPNVKVLEEPWTRFTLREPEHRDSLAAVVADDDVDLIVMGPLVTLGMVGGGTPDEVSEFEYLLSLTRALLDRPVSFWIIHHENKAGDISGAWERVPDCLCHVQALSNGHTRLVFRKARWADAYHGTTLDLHWTDGRSYQVHEQEERDPWAEMREAFRADDEWRTVKESAKLISVSEQTAKQVLSELVRRGEMRYEIGPSGRHGSAHCYRLEGALADLAHLSAPSLDTPGQEQGARCAPPVRGAAASAHLDTGDEAAPDAPSAPSAAGDDDEAAF